MKNKGWLVLANAGLLLLAGACKTEAGAPAKEAPAAPSAPTPPPPPPPPPLPARKPDDLPPPPDVKAPPADAGKTASGLAFRGAAARDR